MATGPRRSFQLAGQHFNWLVNISTGWSTLQLAGHFNWLVNTSTGWSTLQLAGHFQRTTPPISDAR
jgi:hypothetical protein